MKSILFLVCLVAFRHSPEPSSITPDQAKDYVGKVTTVCGQVMGTHVSAKGINFLNFGAPYPNESFEVIVFADDAAKFPGKPADIYNNKTVCVTGKISVYNNKPEIIVNSPQQVEVN